MNSDHGARSSNPRNDGQLAPPATPAPKPRGFAALSAEARRLLSQRGGRVAQASGRAHRFSSEEARAAGRSGGYETGRRRQLAMAAASAVGSLEPAAGLPAPEAPEE